MLRALLGSFGIAIASLITPLAIAQSAVQEFDIPPQTLESALRQIASTKGVQILFLAEDVRGMDTAGVKGRFTSSEAIQELIKGKELSLSTNGRDVFTIKPASPGTKVKSEAGRPPAERVEVTGSRIRRADIEGAQPVTVYSRQDIERSGAATVRELTNLFTQNSAGRDESAASIFLGQSRVQLRGLPAGSTLILLNGRRTHTNDFNLNSIPLAAIDRVEILADSASAVYGADALAGAVNYVLRKDFDGVEFSGRAGTSYNHDATEWETSIIAGGTTGRFSGLTLISYFSRDGVPLSDRDLTSTSDFRRFGGLDQRGTTSYPGNVYALPGRGNLPGLSSTFAAIPGGTGIGLRPADFAATAGTRNRFDAIAPLSLVPEAERMSFFGTGNYRLSDTVDLFVEGLATSSGVKVTNSPPTIPAGSSGAFVRVPSTNPFNPFGVDVGVDYLFGELSPRLNDATTNYQRLLLGARGDLVSRLNWEVSLLADREDQKVARLGDVNFAAVQRAVNDTNPATSLNVFSSIANNNPATLSSVRRDTVDDIRRDAQTLQLLVRGDAATLPAGPLQFVVGADARRESDRTLIEIPSTGTRSALDKARTVKAYFGELAVPLIAAARPSQSNLLEATLAVRHDDYSDFGTATSPYAGLAWRPIPRLLVRGTFGEGFKPPTLADSGTNRAELVSPITDPLRGNVSTAVNVIAGGNPALQPERSRSFTLGFIAEPPLLAGATIYATAFRLKQSDAIQRSIPVNTLLLNAPIFGDRIVRAPPSATDLARNQPGALVSIDISFANFGTVKVQGVDFGMKLRPWQTADNLVVLAVDGTYTDKYDAQLTPGTPERSFLNTSNTAAYPLRLRLNSSLDWSGALGMGAGITARWIGERTDFDGVRKLGQQVLVDLRLSFDCSKRANDLFGKLKVSAGVQNVNNEQGEFANNSIGYDYLRSDLRGRFYYVSVSKAF